MAVSLASVPLLVKKLFDSMPPGVIDAIFFARAACGSLANRVETCCKVSICRWTLASMACLSFPMASGGMGSDGMTASITIFYMHVSEIDTPALVVDLGMTEVGRAA